MAVSLGAHIIIQMRTLRREEQPFLKRNVAGIELMVSLM